MARIVVCSDGARGAAFVAAFARLDAPVTVASEGGEGATLDPLRLGTVLPLLADAACLCWCFGARRRPAAEFAELHGNRLSSLLERLVDSPVRAFVYESPGRSRSGGGGAVGDDEVAMAGERVAEFCRRKRIRFAVVESPDEGGADPADLAAAAARLLGGGAPA
ncbi:hypothetical protein JDY09_06520 [Thermoleophilum album]|uniref:hypothetical protein n=1 Tax=Thermoleophilum album TaxID=29539 RepID=UPI0019930246|nr:hypothetical protein [Thermoleophilum album]MCL6440756.1 hypothetical protein [Thermoleophilum sp.]WDT93041.1 hypothetical protein JDY09_06520 [Thermoleophilum album]